MNKKLLSLVLVLVLVFGVMATSFAQGFKGIYLANGTKRELEEKVSYLERDEKAEGLNDKDIVRIIVELEDKPIIEHATQKGIKVNQLDKGTYSTLSKKLLNKQQMIKSNIESKKIYVEYENEFTNVINGFSCSTILENAKKIEKMEGVKKVSIANVYERPRPNMDTSKDMIEAIKTWECGYNGEGMVVAIIDTGIDPNHKDMKLTNAENGRIKEKDLLGKGLPGKFFTAKVPYGYNYMDNNNIILDLGPDASEHGMHVAGTVGANGEVKGVAPEAQLLAMKVFGNDPGMPSTFGDVIIKAIDDSIALGADVINMSLGSTASFQLPDDPEQMAVERAVNNGVVCSISAGNSNHIGDGYDDPYWESPDYGVVGSPGLSIDSIQVASIENTHIKTDGMTYEGGVAGYTMAGNYNPVEVFKGMKLEYIDCGIGSEEDFEGKDLNGKIALVIRGGLTFVEKIQNAQAVGAAGVIVYNHTDGGDGMINMAYPDNGKIPAVFIGNTDGNKLLALIGEGKNTVEFKGEKVLIENANSGKMSDFTSWGPTPNLDFKPEITAPGGQIYSTLQNNKYGLMSGTSMAAPHVSGGSALVLQRVDKYFGLTGKERVEMAKNLMMSTAKPVADKGLYNNYFGLNNLVSPRREGAGVMDLYGATTTPAIVVDASTGISKVNLKEIGDNVQFVITVKNFGDKELTYNIGGVIQTDLAIDGKISMEAQEILNAPMTFEVNGTKAETITVPANGSANVKVKIDLSKATDWAYEAPLNEIFENGTFVDGFITLTETTDTYPTLNIPYIGFYGDWDKAPIFDKSVYDEDAENAFYGVTALTWLDESGENGTYRFLGFPFEDEEEGPKIANMAFSPNGDGLADSVRPIVSFMRNAKDVQVNILDKNRDVVRRLSNEKYVRKNYFDGGRGAKFNSLNSWKWDGEVYGEIIEGQYTYQIKAKIDYPNAEWQTLEFPVKIDITAPTINEVKYDKEKKILTIDAKDNMTSIYKYEVISKDKVLIETDENVIDLSGLSELPYEVTVKAYDYALNFAESDAIKLSEDSTIPYVFMEKPEAFGEYTTNDIDVKGYVVDKSGLVELKINGELVEFKYDPEEEKYFFETKLHYEDGVHKILVEGKDKAGNEIKFERKIFVDATKPGVEILTKPKRIVDRNTKTIKVKVKVWENSGDIRVIVHGNEEFRNEIEWEYINEFNPIEKELEIDVPLKYGENNIKIIVEDCFGNKVEKVIGKVYRKLF